MRSPLVAAISLGTAGLVTALLFGVFMNVVPTGSLFAGEVASVSRPSTAHGAAAPSHARVGAAVVLPAVRVTASN